MTAVQLLPARQRAVLILRDVLGFRAGDVADILESTEESVTSALKRARATLRQRLPPAEAQPPPRPDSPVERGLVERLTRAFEASDVDGVVALLSEDVRLTMPPLPMEYHGRQSAAKFQAAMFRTGRVFRLVATRANGQPAFGVYLRDPLTGVFHATGLLVLTLAGDRICAMTRFDNSVLVPFGLPRTLPPARNS
ncbi:hypothetical protein GGC64_001902 [Mycobacterium sp. OAS707]|uniref:sigma factor-like helix-turn-helix DNA-binding protein n=1 Tax=Mycobacterium sp. OAS707 TaxID=2663822 RepID=UPI0019EEC887|nr:hypothetical protein [Mycobacterium sp. OAS707]